MKLYYRAVNKDGVTVRGLVEAKNIPEAVQYLHGHQLTPIKIFPLNASGTARFFSYFRRASHSDIVFFTRQLSSILSSGMTLMQALSMLKNQIQKPVMSEITQDIVLDLENGKTFASAIEKYPELFSPVYIAIIRTAESAGLIDKALLRLAENLEKQQNLQRTIREALLYPITVIVMMIVVIIIMMVFVVPQLTAQYKEFGVSLPLPTLIIINMSKFIISSWIYFVFVFLIAGYYFRKWHKKETGKHVVDAYMLKIPIFGKLLLQSMMAEFTRTLGLLIGSGSLIVDSLVKTSDIVGNSIYKDEIMLLAKRVEKGITMGDAMEANRLFPDMVIEMVKIGEQTGKLSDSLLKASEYFEREVEDTVKTLTTLLQPAILLLLAVGVFFLIISVIAPFYKLYSEGI